MSATGLDVFDKTIAETNRFLHVIMRELGTDDRHLALGALRGTLHALRDRMIALSAVHFSAQLPMLLRGLFFEGWHPAAGPTRERHLDDFLDHIASLLPPNLRAFPEEASRAVFVALAECMNVEEIDKTVHQLPIELRQLWPENIQDAPIPPRI